MRITSEISSCKKMKHNIMKMQCAHTSSTFFSITLLTMAYVIRRGNIITTTTPAHLRYNARLPTHEHVCSVLTLVCHI